MTLVQCSGHYIFFDGYIVTSITGIINCRLENSWRTILLSTGLNYNKWCILSKSESAWTFVRFCGVFNENWLESIKQ